MDVLVCLLPERDMKRLGISKEFEVCKKVGLNVEHSPIEDFEVPENVPLFKELVKRVVEDYLNKFQRVVVHCRGGNGRTGLFIACCFVYKGYTA